MWFSFHSCHYGDKSVESSLLNHKCSFLVSYSSTFLLPAGVHGAAPAAMHLDVAPSAAGLPPASHSALAPPQSSHLGLSAAPSAAANPSHQQELQAKILSLFNSGSGVAAGAGGPPSVSQPQAYGSLGPAPPQTQVPPRPAMMVPSAGGSQGYGAPAARMQVAPPGGQRLPVAASGINFDNPSVQKALDTLIQSGPSLNHLVSPAAAAAAQQPPAGMGQAPPMSMYPRHY